MIQNIEHVFKETAETILRRTRRRLTGRAPADVAPLIEQVMERGYTVIENFWSAEQCTAAIEQIEQALLNDTSCHRWNDAEDSDHRLYFAERIGGELECFFRSPDIEVIRRHYSGVAHADTLLLAAKLEYVADNKGSGGGWHRDSPHRSQFKAILYLCDVKPENGPFQYIEGSHRTSRSLALLRDGKCQPNQYRFSSEEIEPMLDAGAICDTITAPAGTLLLADSKGIHRGRPIEHGHRYALTQYCFDGARPPNFLKY